MIRILKEAMGEGLRFMEDLKKRSEIGQKDVTKVVDEIIAAIKEKGDEALVYYTKKFDSAAIEKENLKVTAEEIQEAYRNIDKEFIEAVMEAKANIIDFHEKQKETLG